MENASYERLHIEEGEEFRGYGGRVDDQRLATTGDGELVTLGSGNSTEDMVLVVEFLKVGVGPRRRDVFALLLLENVE
jgi:hypothetical protein